MLKECAKSRVQPRPATGFAAYERNPEVSDFSPYEVVWGKLCNEDEARMKNQDYSSSRIDESKLKVSVSCKYDLW